ncbi:MAG: glucose-6-phosphate dehydrogenase, partial [Calditrichia bacterium]
MNSSLIEVQERGFSSSRPADPCVVVIFGATGDLTHRELVPSLQALHCKGLLPERFAIIGFARRPWSDDEFRSRMKEAVDNETDCADSQWDQFAERLFFVKGNFNDPAEKGYADLKSKIEELQDQFEIPDNVLFHLAVPPEFYGTIINRLSAASLSTQENGWRRIIIEKPFGRDRESARELDRQIHDVLGEEQIYRVDHFLGKETVQNMLVFRFANPGFEPIWNRNYIDHVQITVAENLGIEGRGNFYESTGVVRDMVQNHLLQLLCMTAIEPPVQFDADSLRTETVKVLKSLCRINPEKQVVLGQYRAGGTNGNRHKGYREEENTSPDSTVPTFAALKLTLDNWRWAQVPFYLRTGKRLPEKLTQVTIRFKPTPHLMFPAPGNRK